MAYFTEDFTAFFRELEKNNNKAWFDTNRKRYENSVKKPFAKFIDEMIGRINSFDPEVRITAKDAVMRINRDIRFSPDKTPYNIHYGAIISPTGRKDKSVPGLFLRFSAKGIGIFGGAHGIDKTQIQKIRRAIAEDLKGFDVLIKNLNFKKKFGTVEGEKNVRLPKEFQEDIEKQPLLANKQFYYVAEIGPENITDKKLPETIMDYWHTGKPLKDFLTNAMR